MTWTATASDHGASPVYQFSVRPTGGDYRVVRDFSTSNSLRWTTTREGAYEVSVTVKDDFGARTGESATASFSLGTRVAPGGARTSRAAKARVTISPTDNPLVALYSAPPTSGSRMRVEFRRQASNQPWLTTSALPIVPGKSTNFLVAGLLPKRTYFMRHVLSDGTTSTIRTFKTGALPSNLKFPKFTVQRAASFRADLTQNIVVHAGITFQGDTINTLATNRQGDIVWYYDSVNNHFLSYAASLVPGGTVLMLGNFLPFGVASGTSTLREVDLAGNTLRETNIDAVNAQLAALGRPAINDFNHDAQRLPNGDTAVLSSTTKTIDINGTPTQYTGDMVIVLDQNFQVDWTWDPFAWMDPNRLPTLGEGPTDFTHANSIAWSPADGNLLVSMRSQDWVVKINYANGTGDGHIIWRLGEGGDFTIEPSIASPWFSHQHDVRYINKSTLVLFDNGNVRQSESPQAKSRGQLLVLDEKKMRARLKANVVLGNYAPAVGSAQRLPNGNLAFTSGFVQQTIEVRPGGGGTTTYVLKMNLPGIQYRSYIYRTLYDGNSADPGGPVG